MANTAKKLDSLNHKDQDYAELKSIVSAIDKVQAIIEFDLKGNVLTANDNFLNTLGYSLNEIKGKHHRMFCTEEYTNSDEYKFFWKKLNDGEFDSGEYKRLDKDGKDVWINASYNPFFDENGKVYKIVKFATNITEEKNKAAELAGKMDAISKAQAMIEFDLDGSIQTANDNFLNAVGYSLDEIKGQHHKIFCDPKYADSQDYKEFWAKLNRGEFESGEYKRFGKGGKEIWINASYNPIFNADGKVVKVVKFATDITAEKLKNLEYEAKMAAISKAQAIIEFNLDGSILTANDNFINTVGYSLDEIVGQHHRMFCESSYTSSPEYREFWEKLNRGNFDAGEYKRLGKGGKEVWINASYNPIFDADGKPYKVVKYATDITAVKNMIASVEETAEILNNSATELTATAQQMSSTAVRTSDESKSAKDSIDEVAEGIQIVATNMEEMVASIKEISRSAHESSEMSRSTKEKAQSTNETIAKLGVSSQEIGDVIDVINSIAKQTNLLALNATIEAARAGEAGRGFAVVANEVKELARQTANATNDITNKVSAIQTDTKQAVDAIGGISEAVDKLNAISGSIATAVEEQTASTNEVSRVVSASRQGIVNISETIENVSSAATDSSSASEQTLAASKNLSELSDKLSSLVKAV